MLQCGATGHAIWTGEAGSARTLTELSDGFSRMPQQTPSIHSQISCLRCGTTQPEQVAPGKPENL